MDKVTQLRTQLDELGVSYHPNAGEKRLTELLTEVLGHEPVLEQKEEGLVFEILDTNGQVVRTYSAEAHGLECKALAEEFAAKRGYTVR